MKKVVAAAAILVVIPLLVVFSQLYLKNSAERMSNILSEAEKYEQTGRQEKAEQQVGAFVGQWKSNKKIMETFIRHAELDTINQNMAKLTPYLKNGEDAEFYAECEELRVQLEHIWRAEAFTLDNIL